MRWSYGITTVPSRGHTLLSRTIRSLKLAGFDAPHIFLDGYSVDVEPYDLAMTVRHQKVRTAGNWLLSLLELYVRDPNADRYAVFQDDFVTYKNLRKYLECTSYPSGGYLNLLTFMDNEQVIRNKAIGFHLASYVDTEEERERKKKFNMGGQDGQTGRGAVALVFDNESTVALLSSKTLIQRFKDSTYGHRRIDGGVVNAMNELGFREYIHNPSLVLHTGEISTMGNSPHKNAMTFRGEDFDAMEFLKE